MNTVIEMAREAGFETLIQKGRIFGNDRDGDCTEELEAFATLVRADERSSWPAEMEAMERQVNILTDALAEAKADEREATNNAYRERNQLVALLSTLFPSGKAKTAIEGWDEAWHGCVYIDFPWGQASWHYHTDDEWMFEHLPPYTEEWDGHTTEAKYAMIALAIRARGQA